MDAFLRALQGGQLPAGNRRELDARFGAQVTDDLIAAGLLVPGPRAAHYPCPRLGSACPRDVIENVGDPAFPFVAVPPGPEHCCDAVRLTAEDVATWTTSRQRLVARVAELFRVRGPANLRDEVFPCAHRLGRAAWLGQERDVLLCTNLNGAAPTAFLLARKAQRQPTLVLAHARTRFTSPDVDAHFASGEVVVVFLEDEIELVAGQVQRRQMLIAREPVATYGAPAFCVLVDPEGAREIDEAAYRRVLASAEAELDLLLDLTTTVSAGRHPTGRREDGAFITGSVTPQQGAAYAELMERQQAVRAAEVRALNGVNHPEKLIEAARRELDVKLSRYEWRSTELLRGDTPEAKRYWFRPPEGLRWALLRPLVGRT
jgi:hypothetical protein